MFDCAWVVQGHSSVSAHGRLSNGKRFQFQVAGGDLTEIIKHIKIVFE